MKFFHTALSVQNLAKSRQFYETIFGLTFRSEGKRNELQAMFVNLQDESGNVIELFEHKNPKPLHDNLMDMQQIGIKHIAFVVENIEHVIEKACAHGAKIIWPIKKGITVKRIAFIVDPDGIPIELVELKD